jgi:diguanylate cyclase (GGDEF)-like protein
VLALVGCGPSAALGRVRALMQALAQHRFAVDRDSLHSVTFSAGVAVNPEDGQTIEHLLAIADARLYSAKRQGRNRVVAHDMSDQVRELEQA